MRNYFTFCLFIPFFLGFSPNAKAQPNVKDSVVAVFMMSPTYSILFPGGDFKKDYLMTNSIGASAAYKTKGNFYFMIEANYLFNERVRHPHDILSGIETSDGNVIGQDGMYANINLNESGFALWGKIGKLFPVIGPNKNSGLLTTFGAGFLQHKTRIDVQDNTVPQLAGDYKKGYDKLCSGPALSQFIGYSHMSNNMRYNFFVGLEFYEGFTQYRRAYDINAMQPYPDKTRFDFLFGLKLGWNFPFYKKSAQQRYYYY